LARKNILHMLTPLRHMSPFDVNMALDAGYDAVVPYTGVETGDVAGLVQDAIFSRPPDAGPRTGIFIAGKDAGTALDMFKAAKKALVKPFELSIFADPAGSFTTAAAMVAKVEKALSAKFDRSLKDTSVTIFGATGVVGYCTAVIAAGEGARVTLSGHDGVRRVQGVADDIAKRFDLRVEAADGSSKAAIEKLAESAQLMLCAARAGMRVIDADGLRKAGSLLIAADVNAVPPSGVEGVAVDADCVPIEGTKALGIGPLAIGNVKYKTEFGLFRKMIDSDATLALDFRDAFALARDIAK
jgi:methylene-tetrahydromethanopterin dehydrogenase